MQKNQHVQFQKSKRQKRQKYKEKGRVCNLFFKNTDKLLWRFSGVYKGVNIIAPIFVPYVAHANFNR